MKKNPYVNRDDVIANLSKIKVFGDNFNYEGKLMRKGQVGEHKKVMTKEMIVKFDEWTSNELKDYEDLKKEFM